jgi:DNA replication and repair protein RecF
MILENVRLINFRSYKNLFVELPKEGSLFLGENGSGKTNFFEALCVATLGKSVRNASFRDIISIDEKESSVEISFFEGKNKIIQSVGFSKNNDILVKINDLRFDSFLCLYGNNAFIYFGVDDIKIVKGIPQEKRQFLDMTMSQNDEKYLHDIMKYRNLLRQRNYVLANSFNNDLIDVYDKQISHTAINIMNKRRSFFSEVIPICENIYKEISDDELNVKMEYLPSIDCFTDSQYYEILKENLNKDKELKFTTAGIHRDNFEFRVQNAKLMSFGSQGQCKSVSICLKMAVVEYLSSNLKQPIIVIDDAFSDLDISRKQKFFEILNKKGQIFIAIHSRKELDYYPLNSYFEVKKGQMECFRK